MKDDSLLVGHLLHVEYSCCLVLWTGFVSNIVVLILGFLGDLVDIQVYNFADCLHSHDHRLALGEIWLVLTLLLSEWKEFD